MRIVTAISTMMGKRNRIHRFSMLLLILVTGCISAEPYHIVPNDSTSQCQNYSVGTCFTLAEFASNISHLDLSNHLTLSFLPGEHLLTERLTITGALDIILTGQNSSNSSTIKCQGTSGFEFGDINSLKIEYLDFAGCGNVSSGGAISINRVDMFLVNGCHFINNHVTLDGGAILVNNTVAMNIEESLFNNNSASALSNQSYGGAIRVVNGSIFTINSTYKNNSAVSGGAIYTNSSISSTGDYYTNNSAVYGGAIFVTSGNITSTNNHYINNSVENGGGAIFTNSNGSISCTSDHYINNSAAVLGGAIYAFSGKITSSNGHYINNSAHYGGAIYFGSGNITSTSDQYIKNSADDGGAILVNSGNCSLCNDSFTLNAAHVRAMIHKSGPGILEISQTNITDNKGNLYLYAATLIIAEEVNFLNNQGSLHVSSTQALINGVAVFMNNSGDFGGAITAIQQSRIIIKTASMVTISNNTATYGGGIYLAQSTLQVYHPFKLTDNKASEYGGGIYAIQSEIKFSSDTEQTQTVKIVNNTAALNGGGMCAIGSTIQISKSYVNFNSNRAKMNGGAMYLGQNSKIQLQKTEPDYVRDDNNLNVRLDFNNNSAGKGGAIYIADNTDIEVQCQGTNKQVDCFIQTLKLDHFSDRSITYINTFFTNNTALQSGSDIYGGLLDRCSINPGSELVYDYPKYKNSSGFYYIKATTQIEQIIDYTQYARSHPDYLINNISKSDVLGLISSDGILNFCSNQVPSPTHSHPNVSKNKGELFTVSVAVVDQVGNPVNARVSSSLSSESGNAHLKSDQVEQQVHPGNQCTELEYNVYSQDNSVQIQLHLYPEGHCGNIEVSRLSINLTFLPCECPVGFQPSSSQTECICECDRRLTQHQITHCFANNGTIQLETNIWIGFSNDTNGTGFVIHNCPFDYCVQKPVNFSLNSTDSADEQCAYNRTGNLCGMCKQLSLVFGSSRCQECSSYYIFLLIPFSQAGIALVVFILLFNMTVATGTIHGLIVYANILTANHSLFLPFVTPNFLTVFISWLNLDLGIETYFYNGMDSYSKFLLQLAFPAYVFVLIGTIIVLCEVSKKFATLLGNRNPIAALCTLILLSYSKLIRTIITALQFTHLDYPDGPRKIVWLYDANIPYFTVSHIPRFIAALIIIILGAIFTILLLFGQWFPRCSDRKLMKWTKNTKYNAFIDAYHAPFTPRHRYWMGLLLFALTTHNIVAAMSAQSPAPILSAGCLALALILLRVINTRIYKNRLQDSLETLFLTNNCYIPYHDQRV